MSINASIVLYNTPNTEIEYIVKTLRTCVLVNNIYLIDNSETENSQLEMLHATYIHTKKNIGYGAAHNIAMRKSIESNTTYHLVVNSDINFKAEDISKIASYMNLHPEVGQLMPKIIYPTGSIQYLCKLLPTPLILIGRRFLPSSWMGKHIQRFELRKTNYDRIMNIPYLSGCFMFLRTSALQQVGLFDERFFMYPEDIDLTRRMHKVFKTIFYPHITITHNHAQSSYQSKKMLWIHITNIIKYFNKWGWFIDQERDKINETVLKELYIN